MRFLSLGGHAAVTGSDSGKRGAFSRRSLTSAVLVAVLLLTVTGAPLQPSPTMAQATSSITAWIVVGNPNAEAGCSVEISVEIRAGGAAVVGADVAATLGANGEIFSSERAVSDSEGVAILWMDTSSLTNGESARADVLINGVFVGGHNLAPEDGGACAGAEKMVERSAEVPAIENSVVEEAAEESSDSDGVFLDVPTYKQQRNLSCEYAALTIATGGLGNRISEYEFDELVGWSSNPHWGYRGDIHGWWGNTDDYGVYAAALAPALAEFGFYGEVFYGAGDADELRNRIDRGMPTLVWLGLWGDTSFNAYTEDGTRFNLTPGMHVMVVYGYDSDGVHLSDPASGSYRFYDWDSFMAMWDVLDGMALGVGWA